jgi:hypothetical protein
MLESFFRDPTKLPTVPQPEQDARAPLAFFCAVLMFSCLIAAVVGMIAGWSAVTWWGLALTFILYVAGRLLLPDEPRRAR